MTQHDGNRELDESCNTLMRIILYSLFTLHCRMLKAWLAIPREVFITFRTSRNISHISNGFGYTRRERSLEEPREYRCLSLLHGLHSDSRARERRALGHVESHIDTILAISLDEEHFLSSLRIMQSDEIHIFLEIHRIRFGIVLCMSEGDFVLICTRTNDRRLRLIQATHEPITLVP